MNRIAELRKKQGLSQVKLAKILNMAQNTLSQYETETRPLDDSTLRMFAEFFGESVDYILCREMTDQEKELNDYLEELKNRPEMKMLFKLAKGATKEDVEQAVKIIEALKK